MDKVKYLHIVPDHNKFIKDAIDMFDSIAGIENECWTISKNGNSPIHLNIDKAKGRDYETFTRLCCESNAYDVIVIHNFFSIPYHLISKIHPKIKVIWLSWGMDIYDGIYPEFPLIKLNKTIKSHHIRLFYLRFFNIPTIKSILSKLIRYKFKAKSIYKKAINRIDYYSGVFPIEWNYLKKQNRFFRAKQIFFNYANPLSEFTFENINQDLHICRENIQVGHSGYIYLNHLHTFQLLKKINLNKAKVITPLSYSPNSSKYTDLVISKGNQYFGCSFLPIKEFMPYEDYVNTMKSVKVAIFNIQRQCAVGNCLIAIWNGTKVFFPKKSINYEYFNSIGVKVYSIEDELNQEIIDKPISDDEILSNRKALINNWSYDLVRNKLSDSLVQAGLI